jgi:hypothetical protein
MASKAELRLVGAVCFAAGVAVGFGAGVLSVKSARDFFVDLFRSEERAATASPTHLARPAFSFDYPSNWSVDVKDPDYDADHMFSIDTPGQSFVMFMVADGEVDPRDALELHVTQQTEKVIKDAKRTPFEHYGSFEGHGALLEGKHLGMVRGSVRVFCFRSGNRTFQILENVFEEDRAKVEPGFRLIEKTLRLEGPKSSG